MKTASIFCLSFFIIICSCCKKEQITSFKENNGLIIPIVINGYTLEFLFDTGAQSSSIPLSYLEKIGGKCSSNKLLTRFIHYNIDIETVYSEPMDILIANQPLKDVRFTVDSSFWSKGILGFDIIKQLYWIIDFETYSFSTSSKPLSFDHLDKCMILPYTLSTPNYPEVLIRFNHSKEEKYLFDMGNYSYIDVKNDPFRYLADFTFSESIYGSSKVFFEKQNIEKSTISLIRHKYSFYFLDPTSINERGIYSLMLVSNNIQNCTNKGRALIYGFAKRFAQMCIDPSKQQFIFLPYNSKDNHEQKKRNIKELLHMTDSI